MRRLAVVVTALALVAGMVVTSGLISIKASSGHWAVTAWLLDFAKQRSVATRSMGIEPPALEDESLVRLGAAHFDRGCRPCHGRPGVPPPVILSRMTPHPADLGRQVGRWAPRELFYIVAHGIKFTGMPGWPAPERTDEVWPVVAFLRALPGMDAASYGRLAGKSADDGPGDDAVVTAASTGQCAACHRPSSSAARSPLVPVLAGQRVEYVKAALDAYAAGARKSGIMGPIAAALDAAQRADVADQVTASDDVAAARFDAPAAQSDLVVAGDPARDVPPCASCHGPSDRARDPRFPRLAGQPELYLRLQLRLFAEHRRGGSEYGEIMRAIAVRLTPEHIDQAVRAYAAMPGERP